MTEEAKMMDAPAAANLAAMYLAQMMPQADGILLEEVEKVADGDKLHWLITLSFVLNFSGSTLHFSGSNALRTALPSLQFMGKREYKTFNIDAATGEVVAMKIKVL